MATRRRPSSSRKSEKSDAPADSKQALALAMRDDRMGDPSSPKRRKTSKLPGEYPTKL